MKPNQGEEIIPFPPRKMVVESGNRVHLPVLSLQIIFPLYHNRNTSSVSKSSHLEKNLFSWGKDCNLKEVRLGNKNKAFVSSSFATIASRFRQ